MLNDVCLISGSAGKCYNTGWSSSELNNQKILTLQADLVTAHGM